MSPKHLSQKLAGQSRISTYKHF